jgi:hypothetical protein
LSDQEDGNGGENDQDDDARNQGEVRKDPVA